MVPIFHRAHQESCTGDRKLRQVFRCSSLYASLALVTVVLLGAAAVAAPHARAYIPAEYSASAVGDPPVVSASITHSPEKPVGGTEVTYTGSYSVTNPSNAPMTVTIKVSQPVKAPFATASVKGDLSVENGTVTGDPVDLGDGTWAYSVTVPGGNDLAATFTKKTTIPESISPGAIVTASTDIKAEPSTFAITPVQGKNSVEPGTPTKICSGTAVFSGGLSETSNGAWLADIKFAYDPAKVILPPTALCR